MTLAEPLRRRGGPCSPTAVAPLPSARSVQLQLHIYIYIYIYIYVHCICLRIYNGLQVELPLVLAGGARVRGQRSGVDRVGAAARARVDLGARATSCLLMALSIRLTCLSVSLFGLMFCSLPVSASVSAMRGLKSLPQSLGWTLISYCYVYICIYIYI